MAREQKDVRDFVNIMSDGTFHQQVPEGTEGAIKREYELSDGTKGEKTEIVFNAVSGFVTGVDFLDTNFGTMLHITVTDEHGKLVISTGTSNNFGRDLMEKLPNLKAGKMYRFAPYSFKDDNGKDRRGVSITEGAEYNKDADKIGNFFWDGKKNTHDYPTVADPSKMTKNKWKAHFGEIEDFLVECTKKNIVEKNVFKDADASFDEIDEENF